VPDENRARLLYFFTTAERLPEILESAEISVSSTPIVATWRRRGIRVVWLTDDEEAASGVDRGTEREPSSDFSSAPPSARITVAVSDAQRWSQWAPRHKVSKKARRRLDAAGGGQGGRWWIVARPIPSSEWLRVQDLLTGEMLWPELDPSSDRDSA
jgi:hypothetical protein